MVEDVGSKTKYKVDVYIGSDNSSRRITDLYLEKVKRWANETFPDGYTILRGEGYYDGDSEDSVLLYAFLSQDLSLKPQLRRLKQELEQEAILFVKSKVDYKVV